MTEDVNLLRHWKLEVQNEETNKAALHIMNLAGELNLFSFWRRQNYCLISREMPYPGTDMMTLFSDFLFSIHEEVCINNDLHVVRYDSTFLRVRRVQTSPHFKEALRQPIFASADRVRNRELWGVVETSECTWWLIMRQKPTDDSAPFLFGFWEALLAWLYKLTLSLRPYLSELGTTPL